ncbi:hypothetical protein CAPTEDRAFT_220701 [Capitella teleta]|uniref:Major facilitator superfamily (MFS) profile domain-containing protein n=1 Tax=Capitella teleta TaxID=283909 RepID=R7UXH3_CAPTE|nr:hypothetical protein CAPTEDRAFT_220701 [Capitella teleta]|eukprot:ELU08617.1 hypothetical protein CAPTEDRAFT_220701 [Capitella teleta]
MIPAHAPNGLFSWLSISITRPTSTIDKMSGEEDTEEVKREQDVSSVLQELKFVPKDRGWAWMCVLSGFLMNVLVVGGAAKSFGILFVEIVEKFGSSSAATSWISSLNQCLALTLSPLASTLATLYGTRRVVFIAGFLISTGFILSIFAVSLEYYYFSYGLFVGIGSSLAYSPTVILVGLYFDKRRSLANGLTVAGSGVGGFVFPPIMHWMLQYFGLQGTLLILAGLMLNICVCGVLLRPLSFYSPKLKADKDLENATSCITTLKNHKFDWSLLCVPQFLIYGLSLFFCFCGYPNLFIMLPPHCKNIGFSKAQAAFSVSVIGIFDLIGRVFFGWFSDLNLVSKRVVFISSMAISGVACMLLPLMTSYISICITCGIVGLFAGCFVALIAPILADNLGPHRLPSAFGLAMMFQGISFLFSPPLIGLLEDVTGTWTPSFIVSGACILIGALIPLLQPCLVKDEIITAVELEKTEVNVS